MRSCIAAALALIPACSLDAQTAAPPPPPAASPPVSVTPPVDYGTATPMEGNWTYTATPAGSEATFASIAAQPQLFITCTRATRQVTIARPATGAAPFLNVWTSTQARDLLASFNPATGRLSAIVSNYDPLLDGIAFSRGRFAVGVSGQAAAVVPAWADPARVIEDCRS